MENYRGPERRRVAYASTRHAWDGWGPMAGVVVGVSAAAALTDQHPLSNPDRDVEQRLMIVAAALIGSAAAFLLLRWRTANHNTSLWGGIAFFSAALTLVAAEPAAFGFTYQLDRHALPVSAFVTMIVAWRATVVPEIHSGARAMGALGIVAAGLIAGTTGLDALDVGLPEQGEAAHTAAAALGTVAWMGVATLWIRTGLRRDDAGLAWGSVLFMGLAGWQVAVVGAASSNRPVGIAGTVLVTVGGLAALRGGIESLRAAMAAQGRELQAVREQVSAEQSQAVRMRAAAEERAHEARNALSAVGGAIQTLERYHERLDDETKRRLASGVASELERLQRLVDVDEDIEPSRAFSLREALDPVIVGAIGGGLDLDVQIPEDVVAIGRPQATAGIVQNLLVNAQRHAGGKDVSLRAHSDGERVVLLVCDRGPGVPAASREAIFERSRCSETTGGSGFGLYVSRRLARAQGGDLWVTDRPGAGAVFGFDLASVGRGPVTADVGDQSDELSEVDRA